jgi:hypothetical protein
MKKKKKKKKKKKTTELERLLCRILGKKIAVPMATLI